MTKGLGWIGSAISTLRGLRPQRAAATSQVGRGSEPSVPGPADPPFEGGRLSAPTPAGHVVLPTGVHLGDPSPVASATLASVFLPSWDSPVETQLADWTRLPASEETRALLARLRAQAEQGLGVEHDDRVQDDFRRHTEGEAPDAELARARRAQGFIDARTDVFLSAEGDRVGVCERRLPYPSEVTLPNAEASMAQLGQANAIVGLRPEATLALVRLAAEVLPADAMELLARSGIKVEARPPTERSRYLLDLLGPAHDHFIKHRPERDSRGRFAAEGLYLDAHHHVSLFRWTGSTATLRTTVMHELGHALDRLLGTNGERLSDSPEWKAICAQIRSSPTRSSGPTVLEGYEAGTGLGVPSDYSRKSDAELFVECLTAFVTTHLDNHGVPVTRADLFRINRPAHDFMLDIFRRRVPDALRFESFQSVPLELDSSLVRRDGHHRRALAQDKTMDWFLAGMNAATYACGRPSVEAITLAVELTDTAIARMEADGLGRSHDGRRIFDAAVKVRDLQRFYRGEPPPLEYAKA